MRHMVRSEHACNTGLKVERLLVLEFRRRKLSAYNCLQLRIGDFMPRGYLCYKVYEFELQVRTLEAVFELARLNGTDVFPSD